MTLIFVDCEATGNAPCDGRLTEFGAVEFTSRKTFHGKLFNTKPDAGIPAIPVIIGPAADPGAVFHNFKNWLAQFGKQRLTFVSDNPAYDWQWINDGFWRYVGDNPFGFSACRYYAGLTGNFSNSTAWKSLRSTVHDHNPVNDAMGNADAFERSREYYMG